MLKICLLQFSTARLLLQFTVQRSENGNLELGDHPVEKKCLREQV